MPDQETTTTTTAHPQEATIKGGAAATAEQPQQEEEEEAMPPPPPPAALRQEPAVGVGVSGLALPTNHHLPWYARLDVFRFCRCLRLLGSVMCIIVILLFGVSWWAVAVGVYGPVVRGAGPRGEGASALARAGAALLIAAFTALCAMALWSYFVAVGTDAGRVPAGWHPFEDDAAAEAELRRLGVVIAVAGSGEEEDDDDDGGGDHERRVRSPPPAAGSPFHHNHPGAGAAGLLFPPSCPPGGGGGGGGGGHNHHHTIHQRPAASTAAVPPFASAPAPAPRLAPSAWPAVPYTGDPRDPRRPRWCRKCHCWKPPRSHHCSASERCVLKMDHYCIWVVNCVGLLNYKAFFLFLVYTGLASAFAAAALVPPAVQFFSTLAPDGSLAIAFVALAMDGAFAVALAAFVGMHVNLIRAGCTTIEMYEKERPGRWPYQRGSFVLNLEDVCGPRPWVGGGGGGALAVSSSASASGRGAAGWRRAAEAARWLLAPSHSRESERALLDECLGPHHGALEERRRFLAASNGGGGGGSGGADGVGSGVGVGGSSSDNPV